MNRRDFLKGLASLPLLGLAGVLGFEGERVKTFHPVTHGPDPEPKGVDAYRYQQGVPLNRANLEAAVQKVMKGYTVKPTEGGM